MSYQDSPPIGGRLPAGWRQALLKDVLEQYVDLVEVQPDVLYQHFGVYSFAKGLFRKSPLVGEHVMARHLYRVRADQFIYGRLNAYEGAFGVVSEELDGSYVSGEFPAFKFNTAIIAPRFLLMYFSRPVVWSFLKQKVTGIGGGAGNRRIRLKESVFLKQSIALPPLKEQHRIIAKVESLIAKIDKTTQLREEIQTDAQAMLHSAFQQVIEGAEYRPMAEVAPIVRRPVEIDLDGEYHELGVRSFGKGTFHKPLLNGIDVGAKKLYHIHAGDLVLSNVFAWEGAIAVAKPEDTSRVGSHRFITCVAKEEIATPDFLCFYLLTPDGIEKVREASPGGAGRNRTLGLTKLEKITVPLPSYERQLWFNRLQAHVAAIQKSQAETQAQLDALLPSILDRAFQGELLLTVARDRSHPPNACQQGDSHGIPR